MAKTAITVQKTDVRSSQEWTTDPDMIAVTFNADFLDKATECVAFMKNHEVHAMTIWWVFGYEFYIEADGAEEFIVADDGREYTSFTPQYRVEGCHAKVFNDGRIRAVLPFRNSAGEVWVDIGCLDELRAKQKGELPPTTADSNDISQVCQRLQDPMEYLDGSFVPSVANDAVKVIQRLATALRATQTAHSQTMQYVEKADKFVAQTAALTIWGHDQNDGTPYEECDAPADGHADSHACLMNLIEAARDLLDKGERA